MSVKIFLPTFLFHTKKDCDIYGEIQINENNAVSYFIIAHRDYQNDNTSTLSTKSLRHLGHIVRAGPTSAIQHRDVAVSFAYDSETPNIYLLKLSIKPPETTQVNVFLYDVPKMLQLYEYSGNYEAKNQPVSTEENEKEASNECNDVVLLCRLLNETRQQNAVHKSTIYSILQKFIFLLPNLITFITILLLESKPCKTFMEKTSIYIHYLEWRRLCETRKRKLNITVDKILGVSVMIFLLFYVSHPGDYLLTTSHWVIQKLRLLLRSLKGSPIGLKLNEHLNNFLLDCFNYHVDLWAKFLDLIEPIVRQLFVPIAMLGFIGISFQLASLPVLMSIIGLHAHCFYIYTAVLYKVEIRGIQVLWKVMLGKRYNVLKNRVESLNYVNRQLYLATIFFTSLLFLFPTVLVYYVVFTTLRLCIYLVNLVVEVLRRKILEFPLQSLLKWSIGQFYDMESIHIAHLPHSPSPLLQSQRTPMCMSVFKLSIQKSPLSRVFSCESGILQEFKSDEKMSIKNAFTRMLQGTF
uniref:Phosphatidylinositol N-acetylglucosaminyltransferase subunit Q n=1 Tax=Zeugodacus cucurbitae TaxID=28588 RepID=A0A0A1WSA8_ZEUCU